MKNIFVLIILILPILSYSQDVIRIEYDGHVEAVREEYRLKEEAERRKEAKEAEQRSAERWAALHKYLNDQKMKFQGWKQIKENRYTYTEVGNSGLVRLKKLKERALLAIKQESIRNDFNYEIIEIFEHKTKVGILPKVEVLIQIIE